MMDILNNEQVHAGLIALIVVALYALAQWVRSKVSYTKIVDDYWCYVQPVAEAVRAEAVKALEASQPTHQVEGDLDARSGEWPTASVSTSAGSRRRRRSRRWRRS